MWPITLSGRLPIVGLVGRYLTNYLIGREPTPNRIPPLTPASCDTVVSCGIRTPFGILSPCLGQVAHALLTRPPLKHTGFHPKTSANLSPLDLHVLGTPPAFVLSQDQTLAFNPFKSLALTRNLSLIGIICLFAFLPLLCIVFKVQPRLFLWSPARRSLIISKLFAFVNTFSQSFLLFCNTFVKYESC